MGDSSHAGAYIGESPPFELRNQIGSKRILFRNISQEKVTIRIYPPGDRPKGRRYTKEELWEEDSILFKVESSIAGWGEKALVEFDWGREEKLLTIGGGTLVKIKGENDVLLF
jgi:hypothetical protein